VTQAEERPTQLLEESSQTTDVSQACPQGPDSTQLFILHHSKRGLCVSDIKNAN